MSVPSKVPRRPLCPAPPRHDAFTVRPVWTIAQGGPLGSFGLAHRPRKFGRSLKNRPCLVDDQVTRVRAADDVVAALPPAGVERHVLRRRDLLVADLAHV